MLKIKITLASKVNSLVFRWNCWGLPLSCDCLWLWALCSTWDGCIPYTRLWSRIIIWWILCSSLCVYASVSSLGAKNPLRAETLCGFPGWCHLLEQLLFSLMLLPHVLPLSVSNYHLSWDAFPDLNFPSSCQQAKSLSVTHSSVHSKCLITFLYPTLNTAKRV